jgi:3-oxoadipate CoA-transferase alpha subunit
MAMAAKTAIAQVDQVVELGELDPEHIITGIFVQRVVAVTGAAASSIAKAV